MLLAPVLLFVAFLLWQFASGERVRLERDAGETARTIAASLDRDITSLLATLDVISTATSLQTGDLAAFYEQAVELQRRQGIVSVLADPTGQQLINVRLPRGGALPKTNLPWNEDAIRAGRAFVTDLFTGIVSREPLFAIATAVKRNGEVAYILNFSLSPERLQRLLAEADVPEGYAASIVDRAGIVMARNQRPEETVGKMAQQEFLDAATGSAGTWSGPSLDGVPIFAAYARSRVSGFRAAVGVRYDQLNAPLWRSLSWFAALGAIVAALSVVLAIFFGQRITRPIAALADRASMLGRGEPVPRLDTGLREANLVGAELASASESLRSREADLREANEEIQRFAYIVSHDLRSPLVNIMGFTTELEALRADTFRRLEALRDAGSDPAERSTDRQLAEDFDEAIGFIKTSIGKMDRLINAILRLSREGRRDFHPERLDMNALLGGVVGGVAHQAEEAGATVTASRVPDLISDRLALEQVLSNLVENAIKYLRRGVAGRIEIGGRGLGGSVVYEVRDNGRGIDPRDRERVFELFRRSGVQDRPGEGIGLAHVRALVRRLGGTVTLTSELGQGSTFTVTLPRRWAGGPEKRVA